MTYKVKDFDTIVSLREQIRMAESLFGVTFPSVKMTQKQFDKYESLMALGQRETCNNNGFIEILP